MKMRMRLTFPQTLIKEPVIFTVAKKYNVIPNIVRAWVTENIGVVEIDLEGTQADLADSVMYFRNNGVDLTFP